MRMKKTVENRTLKSAAAEFLAFKRAQKIRERTLHDYQKYIRTNCTFCANTSIMYIFEKKPASNEPAGE